MKEHWAVSAVKTVSIYEVSCHDLEGISAGRQASMRTNSKLQPLLVDIVCYAFQTRWKSTWLCQDSAIEGTSGVPRTVCLPTVIYI